MRVASYNPSCKRKQSLPACVLLCIAALCFTWPTYARDAVTYRLTYIATPQPEEPNDLNTFLISDLNNKGEVLGAHPGPDGVQHAFIWRDGVFHDLNRFVAPDVIIINPNAFNDRSESVGVYYGSSIVFQPFFLGTQHRAIPLTGVVGDREHITPVGINNRDEILIDTYTSGVGGRAIVWRHGKATTLQVLPGADDMIPLAINNKGIAIGYGRHNFLYSTTPVLWQDGTVMPLPGPPGSDGALPVALNDGNVVALWAVFRDEFPGREQAYLWHDGTITVLLPPSPDLNRTVPNAMNDSNVVTGFSYNLAGKSVPTIWRGRRGQDVNTLICPTDPLARFVHIDSVGLINERGQILAHGTDSRQPDHLGSSYLLTPKVRHKHPQ